MSVSVDDKEQVRLMASRFEVESLSYPRIEKLDDNVLATLPSDTEVISIEPSGASGWVQTLRINTRQKDGNQAYFMKVHTNKTSTISLLEKSSEDGRKMMGGIYESEKALYDYSPGHIPRPMGWGVYAADPNKWFYICEFHDMIDEVPEAKAFVSMISQLHKASMGKSPTGMYGFHVTTHIAILPNDNTWQSSWEVWFAQAMRKMLELEEMAHGQDPKLEILKEKLFDQVIPRLLRPLETGGRSIQPCLIHSDLWPGNIMTDIDTDEIMIFDSCTFWGHNEADLGSWRAPRYKLGRPFFKEYQKAMGLSEPHNDWDDRNALYAIRYDLLVSALYARDMKFRSMAMAEMQRLADKFPNGYDEYDVHLGLTAAESSLPPTL